MTALTRRQALTADASRALARGMALLGPDAASQQAGRLLLLKEEP